MNNHTEFILSPIADILSDVVNSSAGIGDGIETFPLCDYVMQSVFLKMTGFQEQKMKSVCWGLASNDYEYRYEFTKTPLGECSNYKDKQIIYRDLIKQIKKRSPVFNLSTDLNKTEILADTALQVRGKFAGTNLSVWAEKSFNEFESVWNQVQPIHFANDEANLFASSTTGISLKKIYEDHLYRHRNRIAHNTQSYQQNLPTLKTLINNDYRYENYFIHFSLLVLIDSIFIELFRKYLLVHEEYAE
jgi:hypothetical protein